MALRFISTCGAILLCMASWSARSAGHSGDCTAALREALQATADSPAASSSHALPDACRSVGPVSLGMSREQVLAALGKPDKQHASGSEPDGAVIAYVFPRNLDAQLARHPVAADRIAYSELGIRFQRDKVVNIAVSANAKAPVPFRLLGRLVGADVNGILRAIGGRPQWNASRDYVQFDRMPIGISVDPDTSGITGLGIAETKRQLDTFQLQGLDLVRDERTGLFKGFR